MKRKYYLFDAEKEILGRMSVKIANVISGRKKIDFSPNVDNGDYAVVIKSDNLKTSGNKRKNKVYHNFSGYPGGIKSLSLGEKMEKDSRKIVRESVYGMLPKNKLREKMIKRLLVFKDEKHNCVIDASD